jgi:hypothetical protein
VQSEQEDVAGNEEKVVMTVTEKFKANPEAVLGVEVYMVCGTGEGGRTVPSSGCRSC